LCPDQAQLFLGQRRKAIALFIVFALLLVGFWPVRLLRFYPGFIALFFSMGRPLYLCSLQCTISTEFFLMFDDLLGGG